MIVKMLDLSISGVVDTGVAEQGENWEESVTHLHFSILSPQYNDTILILKGYHDS